MKETENKWTKPVKIDLGIMTDREIMEIISDLKIMKKRFSDMSSGATRGRWSDIIIIQLEDILKKRS